VEHFSFSIIFSLGFLSAYEAAFRTGGHIDTQLRQWLPHCDGHWTDNIWLGMLVFSMGLTVLHKYSRGGGLFLLQPCHVTATMLIVLLAANPKEAWTHTAFNILLGAMWGSWMAVLFPDLRDYKLFCEIENFFLEHALIVGLPLLFIAQGRFLVFPMDIWFSIAAFLFNGAFHSLVLHTVALISGLNLNYQLQPPPVKVVEGLGKSYKWIVYPFTFLLTVAMRYIFVEAILALSGRPMALK
jgi:hypothetical protein